MGKLFRVFIHYRKGLHLSKNFVILVKITSQKEKFKYVLWAHDFGRFWALLKKKKNSFTDLNLSTFATVGNRSRILPWMNFNFRSRHIGWFCLSHKHVPTFQHFLYVLHILCAALPPLLIHSLPRLSASLALIFEALSVLSHTFPLSVSFWFSLWSPSSRAWLGGGLAATSQAAVCCWSYAMTEALWLTCYLFV